MSTWKLATGGWLCVCGYSFSWEHNHAFLIMIKYNKGLFSPSRLLSLSSKLTVAIPFLVSPLSSGKWLTLLPSLPYCLHGLLSSGWPEHSMPVHPNWRTQGCHALAASPPLPVEGSTQSIPSGSPLTFLPSAGTQCPSCSYLHFQQEMLCKQNCSQSFNC